MTSEGSAGAKRAVRKKSASGKAVSGPVGLRFSARDWLSLALILALTVVVYSWYGFDGGLSRDGAVYLYSGQRMAEGIPPYVSVFDHKGPLAPMLAGAGVMLSELLNADDVTTVRVVFFVAGCLAVAYAYVLGGSIFRSRRASVFTALVFLGLFCFARFAISEPEAKTPMIFFEVLALLFMSRKNWFRACLFGSLAALVWQPMAIFPLVGVLLAALRPGGSRPSALLRAAAGTGIPVALVAAYFYANGALYDLINGSVLFNLRYLERDQFFVLSRFVEPLEAIFGGNSTVLIPLVVFAMAAAAITGLLALARMYLPGESRLLERTHGDALIPVLLSLPFPVFWSLMDFQGYPDFYVFVPYAALGFGGLLDLLVSRIETASLPQLLRKALAPAACAALVVMVVIGSLVTVDLEAGASSLSDGDREPCDFECQERAAQRLQERFGPNATLVSVGAPEPLVLLGETNPNRYPFIIRGIDREISAQTPDGFDGWLRELRAYDPDVISFGETTGRNEPELHRWLNAYYDRETLGPWTIYVKEDPPNRDGPIATN